MKKATPRTTPVKKGIYILPSNVATVWICSVCLSFQKPAQAKYAMTVSNSNRKHEQLAIAPRSPKHMRLSHFTLLFCRGQQRNEQIFKTHVQSHCSAPKTFCFVAFSLPLLSWFARASYYYMYFFEVKKWLEPVLGVIRRTRFASIYFSWKET